MNSSRNNGPERRGFGRRHSNDHAIVRVQGRPPVRCTVKNISDTGALLDFGAEVWLPYNFRLAWEVGTRSEECEIKHRNGQFVGVFFQRHVSAGVPPASRHQPVRADDVTPWIAETNPRR